MDEHVFRRRGRVSTTVYGIAGSSPNIDAIRKIAETTLLSEVREIIARIIERSPFEIKWLRIVNDPSAIALPAAALNPEPKAEVPVPTSQSVADEGWGNWYAIHRSIPETDANPSQETEWIVELALGCRINLRRWDDSFVLWNVMLIVGAVKGLLQSGCEHEGFADEWTSRGASVPYGTQSYRNVGKDRFLKGD
jgi:hypothetical protein